MTFTGVIVNPLTAVRDRSQMRGDYRGPVHALAPGAWPAVAKAMAGL
jgi:hypothetical protein